VAGQIQDASFKLSDEAPVFLGKADLDLADGFADVALYPLDLQLDDNPFQSKAGGREAPPGSTSFDDLVRTATRTSKSSRVLLYGKNDLLSYVIGPPIPVAHDVEGVVQ
jgi:hypothetical protein